MKTAKDETNMSHIIQGNMLTKSMNINNTNNNFRPISAVNKRPEKSLRMNTSKNK